MVGISAMAGPAQGHVSPLDGEWRSSKKTVAVKIRPSDLQSSRGFDGRLQGGHVDAFALAMGSRP